MLQEFIPILILACIAALIGLSIILLAELFGPKKYSREKLIPYECGVTPFGAPRHPFAVKYYLVALFFLIFDVEVLFFYPWA
ncbi:MAG: NADH-quinone oxidoreductase subunit A, partial [Deltaproteobacteria bacterium]|nr:NADH-quinone oxidoreductase subunit A [Deltaproteobacteria bacterium]